MYEIGKHKIASRFIIALMSVALVFTMMPLSMGKAFAEDASAYQPALTITKPDGNKDVYTTREEAVTAFGEVTDNTLVEGKTLKGIPVKKLLSGYDDNAVVTVQTQDDYDQTKLKANGKTVKELKDLKGLLAYAENDVAYDPVTVNKDGGYFVFYVGKDSEGNLMKDKWVNRITISKASGGETPTTDPTTTDPVLSMTGDVVKALSFADIKTLKNDESIKALTRENVTFHTVNSFGTEADITVTGVRIEDLIGLAGLKEGMEVDSVTATANDGYAKTYTADQVMKEDLQGNKAMFIWVEDGTKVQKTAVGQFAAGEQNKGLWVKGDTIALTVKAKAKTVDPTPSDDPTPSVDPTPSDDPTPSVDPTPSDDPTPVVAPVAKKVKAPGKVKIKSIKATKVKGKARVTLKWGRVKGAKGYVIYRATKKKGKYKAVKTFKKGTSIKFIDKKVKKNKRYYYKVRAYKLKSNGKKVFGKYSVIKSVKTRK